MTGDLPPSGHERRLDEVVLAYLKAVDAGQAPDRRELLARHPDLADDLAAFFADQDDVPRRLDPLRQTAPEGPPLAPAPLVFADYEVLEELGRGGMGVVYKARDRRLPRVVALKMIRDGQLAGADDVNRFRCEAKRIAELDHPNIVTVYEAGERDGRHFFSMPLMVGSLAQRVAGAPLEPKEAVRVLLPLARAIDFVHRKGIIHRDLKPANVLFDRDDQPHVSDFGLAKKLDEPGQTAPGVLLGTPEYMRPEQANPVPGAAPAPAVDVYGLGAILYEALTGRPPFRAATLVETLRQVRENEPAPPRLLNPQIDVGLQAICLTCLEKDPARRYPSAAELADDLLRWQKGESPKAQPPSWLGRVGRMLRYPQTAKVRTWSEVCLLLGAHTFVFHFLVFLLLRARATYPLFLLNDLGAVALWAAIVWWCRGRRGPPLGFRERQILTTYAGTWLALLAVLWLPFPAAAMDAAGYRARIYPVIAALVGLSFFIQGGLYWRGFFAIGCACFSLAGLLPWRPQWAPLEYAVVEGGCMVALGISLRRLSRRRPAADKR